MAARSGCRFEQTAIDLDRRGGMPISGLSYGSLLTQPINSAGAVAAGFTSPYPNFVNQLGANAVYQSLRPYPQYTAVTSGPGEGSGQQKFHSLQTKAKKRLSGGLTLFGYVTWAKSFSLAPPNTAATGSCNSTRTRQHRSALAGHMHCLSAKVSTS